MKDPETFLVGIEDFKEQYDESAEKRRQAAERHADLERLQVGLFQASPPDNVDAVHVEISKLQLRTELTAMELYQMDKHPPEDVPWGSRPAKALVVDGLEGIPYYFLLDMGKGTAESPVFFNVYLAGQGEGWIISCSCKYGEYYFKTFNKYKPIFHRIVANFRRIRSSQLTIGTSGRLVKSG